MRKAAIHSTKWMLTNKIAAPTTPHKQLWCVGGFRIITHQTQKEKLHPNFGTLVRENAQQSIEAHEITSNKIT